MNTFNSLGSNYNLKIALSTLFSFGNSESLKNYLKEKYNGEVNLFYKGREALNAALKIIDTKGDVIYNDFTCEVVIQAIVNAGLHPMALDPDPMTLNFTYEDLRKKITKNTKAVIVQHTLGNLAEIEKISRVCKEKNIVLIEDLAHSINGKHGDFVCLSFSQDKIIDAVSGGALIIRNKKYQNKFNLKTINVDFGQQLKDRFYPILTWKIRKLFPLGFGKPLHYILKKINVLSNPIGKKVNYLRNLPGWQQKVALNYFKNLDKDMENRKKIINIYKKDIDKKFQFIGVWLIRFPIKVANRSGLIKNLKDFGVYVSDIWYEEKNKYVLNLPTHKNVSENDAKEVSKLVNTYAKI